MKTFLDGLYLGKSMLKKCMLLVLLAVGQLSAETTIIKEEPVVQTLSPKQKIIIASVMLAGNLVVGKVLIKAILDCFSNRISVGTKALQVTAAFGASVVLSVLEDKFFEKYPTFFLDQPIVTSEQETTPLV